MAQYIERANVTDALIDNTSIVGSELEEAVNAIFAIPSADVRPVVLCRDCKHWELSKIEPSFHVCTYICGVSFVRNAEDFCSRGEKREES